MSQNKYLGCIYGLAIGDALGFPNEFIDLKRILEKNKGQGTKFFEKTRGFPAGTYTDDTQMTLAIAKALLKSNIKEYNIEEIMKNITDEFVKWSKSPDNNRAPGNTSMTGCQSLSEDVHWKKSGINKNSCGSAMRSAPIGLVFYDNLDKLIEVASESSRCTHAHPTAISASIGTAYLTSLALQGIPNQQWINNVLELNCFNEEFKDKIEQINSVLEYKDHFKALSELGKGHKGDEAVALALYCVLKNPADYMKTVLMGANTAGDSDSIACIAGAISGALNGIENIPKNWIETVENSNFLREIAERLYKIKK